MLVNIFFLTSDIFSEKFFIFTAPSMGHELLSFMLGELSTKF